MPDQLDLAIQIPYSQPEMHAVVQTFAVPSGDGWTDFEVCGLCLDKWNRDFCGPVFGGMDVNDSRIRQLNISITTGGRAMYPVLTSGYLYDNRSMLLGLLDLRYFGTDMPRELQFDVSAYDLPMSTRIQVAFQVSGGGTPNVLRPPLITSIAVTAIG